MALNFPSNPAIGDEYSAGGFTWVWNGSSWEKEAATTGGNGFYLYLDAAGNTNFNLVTPQLAGGYYITSSIEDTTYDIYAINSSGDLVGYTNNRRLISTDEFVKVVVIGGTQEDILQFDSRITTFTTSKNDFSDGAPAFITSVSVNDLESFNDATVIIGGNFATDVQVYFVGTNAIDLAAKSIVRTSSSELLVTRPDNLIPDYAPYDVKVINPGIPIPSTAPTQHILENAITAGNYPSWITPSLLFWDKGETTLISLQAADAEGSDIDYQIIDGALFDGLSLDQETGVISGIDSGLVDFSKARFTVRATDSGGNFSDRVFDLYINGVTVHSFYFDPFISASEFDIPLFYNLNL